MELPSNGVKLKFGKSDFNNSFKDKVDEMKFLKQISNM